MGLLQRMISYFTIKVGNKLILLNDRASRCIVGGAGCHTLTYRYFKELMSHHTQVSGGIPLSLCYGTNY